MMISEAGDVISEEARQETRDVSSWERCTFACTRAALRWGAAAGGLDALYRFGSGFGGMEWLINYKRRRRFAERMTHLLGREPRPAERRDATRRYFVRTRCDKMYYLGLDRFDREAVLRRFDIVNRHLIDDALERGRGVYVALSHVGAHHVFGMLMILAGFRVAGVRDPKEGAMRRFILEKFERQNKEAVRYFFSDSFPRDVYRCFTDNFVVGSAIDVSRVRSKHLKTVDVTLFGKQRPILTGPLRIAMRCGAPVVQGLLVSRPGFRYTLELRGPLIDPDRDVASDETLRRAAEEYARNLEAFSVSRPCHLSRV